MLQVEGWIVSEVAKVRVAFTFRVKESRKNQPRFLVSFGWRFAHFGVIYK